MKKVLPLLLIVLLLSSCQSKKTTTHTSSETAPPSPVLWEVPLPKTGYTDIFAQDDFLLLLSVADGKTTAEYFSLKNNEVTASVDIPYLLSKEAGNLRVNNDRICYLDPEKNSIIVLDTGFELIQEIDLPSNYNGSIIIAEDMQTAFFCNGLGIHSINLENQIVRQLNQQKNLHLVDTLFASTILVCTDIENRTLYFDASDGHTYTMPADIADIQTSGKIYTAVVENRYESYRLIGSIGVTPLVFLPEGDCYALVSDLNSIITTKEIPGCNTISAYDITTGNHIAEYPTNASKKTYGFTWHEKSSTLLYYTSTVFDKYTLCSLDLQKTQATYHEKTVSPYYTQDNPDIEGIESCKEQVEAINKAYHIEIALSPESYSEQSVNTTFISEYRAAPYRDALNQLEAALAYISMCDLSLAAKNTPDKTIYIGIFHEVIPNQSPINHDSFWYKGNYYIALSCGEDIADQFYHSLGLFLDSRINSLGNYFDEWNAWNPDEFEYSMDYSSCCDDLEEENKPYFISSLASVSPSDDRAELFRMGMNEDNYDLFDSYYLQSKLRILCRGLRNVFQLSDSGELPWEVNLDYYY